MASKKKAGAKRPGAAPDRRVVATVAMIKAKPGAVGTDMRSAVLYKVMGKMFAILSPRSAFVILKSDPHLAEMLREKYAGIGHRSHLDRRFWISVNLDGTVPAKEIRRLVDQSYDLVCAGLTRKQQAELDGTVKVRR
jgi:predicted DNA-binding protein (MmcQ/YjbR family)